jgi:hypothetical protein
VQRAERVAAWPPVRRRFWTTSTIATEDGVQKNHASRDDHLVPSTLHATQSGAVPTTAMKRGMNLGPEQIARGERPRERNPKSAGAAQYPRTSRWNVANGMPIGSDGNPSIGT